MYTNAIQNPINWGNNLGGSLEINTNIINFSTNKIDPMPIYYNEIRRYEGGTINPYGSTDPTQNPSGISTDDPGKTGKKSSSKSNGGGKYANRTKGHMPRNYRSSGQFGYKGGGATRGVGIGLFVFNVALEGYNVWTATKILADLDRIEIDRNMLNYAIRDFNDMKDAGLIPPGYQSKANANAIINFIYQGINNTEDPKVEEIGLDILRRKGR